MSCRAVRDWLHREVDAIDDAQRLRLEDHLAACERCRGDRERLRLVRRVAASLPVPPADSRAYSRAIARALLDDGASARAPVRTTRRWIAVAAAGLAAAIAVAVISRGGGSAGPDADIAAAPPGSAPSGEPVARDRTAAPPSPAPSPAAPSPEPAPDVRAPDAVAGDIVEDGALIERSAAVGRGAVVPPDVALHTARPARLRFAAFRVVVAASSELRWSATERALLLVRGSLDIDGSGPGVARVVTERFEVELGDTAATVEPAAVRVRRGAARIVDRARRPVARVEAGGTWRVPSPAPANPAEPSAAALLALARSQLAAGDQAGAERTAARALAVAASRGDIAEARTFLGDVAQASGAPDRALERYLAVAAEFAELPVAESALYAAARLELRRSRTAAAHALLQRYLARYPAGRYAEDARRELGRP